MQLTRFELRDLRNLATVELQPGPGLNLLLGANGAGKTSVLEGLHLLAYGRSFRGRVRDGLVVMGDADGCIFLPDTCRIESYIKGRRVSGRHQVLIARRVERELAGVSQSTAQNQGG